MRHYHSLEETSLQNSWLTVGVFDGVHRGHREIIQRLVRDAHQNNAPAAVLTFHPHPANVLTGKDIRCLTTPDERAEILGSLGVDAVITQRFTPDLSTVPAHEYMATLKQRLGLSHLLIGYDFALGKGREGNALRLAEIGAELGYTVEVIPALGDESGVISSTSIRKLISTGNVSEAGKLLGHPYMMAGAVIHGAGRGRKINFPTANVDYPVQKATPTNGIYACWAMLREERFMAATNIGFNPTFTPERQTPSLEAYLLDFDRDIYNQYLKLEFIARLRDEIRYTSIDALINQIQDDVNQTRAILSTLR
ncbi:MAG TPA: bifunctional riboflavin kinase/FAD synthetase [Anaerolineales bacterium]|nr:bifunctional riboflavin kinase/FAD synthetase [Anaerolineales bacterium]HNN13894.1 bifunctional riboflavin kinase/FAD synthetase [Anaerolineales bacterium]